MTEQIVERLEMVTVAEACRITGVSKRKLRVYIDACRLRSYEFDTDRVSLIEVRRVVPGAQQS